VVFDLDGTLVDSRRDLASSVNAVREDLGLSPLDLATVEAMVGEGARLLLRRALPPELDGDRFEDALGRFLELYYEHCLDATTAYPGMAEVLAEIAPRCRLAVLTNKPERHSRKILAGVGLGPYFPLVIGGDTLGVRKPDPGGLRAIAERWHLAVSELLLVGDSGIDAATAAAAGTPLVLVGWGYGREAQLAGLGAPRVDDAAALLAALR